MRFVKWRGMLLYPTPWLACVKSLAAQLGFILALAVIPSIGFAQELPAPAQPRPPLAPRPELPAEEAPEIQLVPGEEKAPPGAQQVFVVLKGVVIEGATVYSTSELKETYQDLIGQQVPLARVFAIADQIQEKYRADGYVLTRVIVPAQSVEDGVFRLRVVEGFINSVRVEGEVGPVKKRIEAYLARVIGKRPVREQDLERYLLLSNDIPGLRAVGVLRAGAGETGASELVVQVERKPYAGFVLVNNRGSRFTGPERAVLSVSENSSTALGEKVEGFFLNTLFNDEQRYGELSYQQLLGNEGLTVKLSAGYGPSEPGFTLEPFDVETESLYVDANVSYPLIRSRGQNLYLDAGFQVLDAKVDVLGDTTSRDRLRLFYVDATYDFSDRFRGQSLVGLGLRQGVDAFGATEEGSDNLSRAEGVPDFTTLNLKASRYQAFTEKMGVYAAGIGQFAFNTLLSDAEFRVGGEQFGRGYDPSELAGDHGLGLTAELQYTETPPFTFWDKIQGYGYYDLGVVWNRDGDAEERASLASAGLGIRNQFLNNLFADLEIAFPLTREVGTRGDRDPRFFFQVLARF